ncbi:MAG: Nramp family divalent metal transporter [Planctomycetota bacterium]|nr:Nramp family divalent metal transporter [Planctomycetota bacterium]
MPQSSAPFVPPHPGSQEMPRWDAGELPAAPRFNARSWAMLLGPGLVMGGAAIGGGEWITGPAVTARYGGSLLWLATLSIVFQVIYNLEISRYTLYTGEPIFTGKFRLLPGPRFWMVAYLFLDFGSFFPYLVASAATPLSALFLGHIPNPDPLNTATTNILGIGFTDKNVVDIATYGAFLMTILPLLFGGKVYNSLKAMMTVKIAFVLIFLTFLAVVFSSWSTWREIGKGFLSIGNVPVRHAEDVNGNGRLDPGEDWDGDGHLDVDESLPPTVDTNGDGKPDAWEDKNKDGKVDRLDKWNDLDGDGTNDGDNVDNIFVAMWEGRAIPPIQLSMIGMLAAMAAISGSGGLTNTSISGYTRDQGWGMGKHVGAIPSAIGRKQIRLSHVGMVFPLTTETIARFRRWYRHVLRDQLIVWMPACFIGIALPGMLSIVFLKRGTESSSDWEVAGLTANGVRETVAGLWGGSTGELFWYLMLFCGLIILWPSAATTADGFLRRWVDVFWTGSRTARQWGSDKIGRLYFGVICAYTLFGLVALSFGKPAVLLELAATVYNFALGFSCFHVLAVNQILLPKPLRSRWYTKIALALAGIYFFGLAIITTLEKMGVFKQG